MMRHATGKLLQQGKQQRLLTTTTANRKKKPLVILCGWLGGQLPQLRRYEELWKKLGYATYPLVASTAAVVDACLHLQSDVKILRPLPPKDFSNIVTNNNVLPPPPPPPLFQSKMPDWAWHITDIIHQRQPECFVMHVFSNGGCFVWEMMNRLWEHHASSSTNKSDDLEDASTAQMLQHQQSICIGVIFDSCPAWFGDNPKGLWAVLQTCPPEDLQAVVELYGEHALQNLDKNLCRQRNQEYLDCLAQCAPMIPQLYLYSHDDLFANATYITKLIERRRRKRRQQCSAPTIMVQQWERSQHCAHLRKHPEDYQRAIQQFVMNAIATDDATNTKPLSMSKL